jgi:hypothetical protein
MSDPRSAATGLSTRRPRWARLVAGVLATVVASLWWAVAAGGDPTASVSGGDLQPIVGDSAQPLGPGSPTTDIRVDGRRISALPVYVQVDAPAAHAASDAGKTTVIAYSLDLTRSALNSATTWTATSLDTPGINGVRAALWLAKDGGPLPANESGFEAEAAARQVAIWHYSNGLAITPRTVPDRGVRRRARVLAARAESAPGNVKVNPVSIAVAASVADVQTNQVILSLVLGTNGETSFCGAQKLDIRVDDGWGVVNTGTATALSRSGPGRLRSTVTRQLPGAPCPGASGRPPGPSVDYNQALFSIARPSQGTAVEIDWNLTLDAATVLAASNGGAPLVVAGSPSIEFRQVVALDPSAFPTAANYLQRFLTSLLRSFDGALAIALLVVLMYLTPRLSRGLDFGFAQAGKAAGRRWSARRDRTGDPEAGPDGRPAEADSPTDTSDAETNDEGAG